MGVLDSQGLDILEALSEGDRGVVKLLIKEIRSRDEESRKVEAAYRKGIEDIGADLKSARDELKRTQKDSDAKIKALRKQTDDQIVSAQQDADELLKRTLDSASRLAQAAAAVVKMYSDQEKMAAAAAAEQAGHAVQVYMDRTVVDLLEMIRMYYVATDTPLDDLTAFLIQSIGLKR